MLTRRSSLAAALLLALAITPADATLARPARYDYIAASRSCLEVGFSYHEITNDDERVSMSGNAQSTIDGRPIKKVAYEFVARNRDSGYKRTYKGTDPSVDGEWSRLVSPRVGFGHIIFTYRVTATLNGGLICKSNLHTLTLDR